MEEGKCSLPQLNLIATFAKLLIKRLMRRDIALYVVLSHSVTRYTTAVYIATLPPSAATAITVFSS